MSLCEDGDETHSHRYCSGRGKAFAISACPRCFKFHYNYITVLEWQTRAKGGNFNECTLMLALHGSFIVVHLHSNPFHRLECQITPREYSLHISISQRLYGRAYFVTCRKQCFYLAVQFIIHFKDTH